MSAKEADKEGREEKDAKEAQGSKEANTKEGKLLKMASAAKKCKSIPTIESAMDPRLNMFNPVPLLVDYEKSFYKTFKPVTLSDDTKVFKLGDPQAFMNTKSLMLLIQGRILQLKDDGTSGPVPTVNRMTKLAVSLHYFSSLLRLHCIHFRIVKNIFHLRLL